MKVTCNYCDYHKEYKLPEHLLAVSSDESLPEEDRDLWKDRMVRTMFKKGVSLHGMRIHTAKKHKNSEGYELNLFPILEFSEEEKRIINKGAVK